MVAAQASVCINAWVWGCSHPHVGSSLLHYSRRWPSGFLDISGGAWSLLYKVTGTATACKYRGRQLWPIFEQSSRSRSPAPAPAPAPAAQLAAPELLSSSCSAPQLHGPSRVQARALGPGTPSPLRLCLNKPVSFCERGERGSRQAPGRGRVWGYIRFATGPLYI